MEIEPSALCAYLCIALAAFLSRLFYPCTDSGMLSGKLPSYLFIIYGNQDCGWQTLLYEQTVVNWRYTVALIPYEEDNLCFVPDAASP